MEEQKRTNMKLINRWYGYWFRPAPVINLAICRIVIISFQLGYLIKINYLSHFANLSKLPDSVYNPLWILRLLVLPLGWKWRPPLELLEIIYWITVAVGILALIGFRTNPSLMIFALGNIFMQAFIYSFGEFHHPEALMMITLVILAMSPAGAALSVDDLRRRRSNFFERGRFENFNIFEKKSLFARWPLLLVQWIFALIYFSAFFSKISQAGFDWMNGYTLQYYLIQDGIRWGSDLGIWLGQHHTAVLLLSWISIIFEGTFILVLIFPRLAWFYIPAGVAFHIGIYLTQKAPFFQYLAIFVVFIPWADIIKYVSSRFGDLGKKEKPEVFFDGQCSLCIRSMVLLRYFDWFNRLSYCDFQKRWSSLAKSHPEISFGDLRREMHLVLPNGKVYKGFFAFRSICKYMPLFWPLLVFFYFPFTSVIGPKIYGFVANRRPRFQDCPSGSCSIHS